MSRRVRQAFSLVEVVIAVGVLSVAVAGVLAGLPTLTRQLTEAADEMAAQRLAGAVQTELVRLQRGGSLAPLAAKLQPLGNAPTLTMVAPHDGREVREESASNVPAAEQYFAVELWRFPANTSLAWDPTSGAVLAVHVRVSWPFRRPGQDGRIVETKAEDRTNIAFTLAVNR